MLNVSSDLIALARSQVVLLNQTLGAASSAMYVTEDIVGDRPPQLIEVVTYPDQNSTHSFHPLLLPSTSLPTGQRAMMQQGRIVVPLIYQDGIMGFLMTGRDDREWTEQEQVQIQQVANTLAIACALDRRSQWWRDQIRTLQEDAYLRHQDFIASLFHQLRNPLTAIRTFGQLLRRRLLPEDSNHQLVEGIMRETGHIQDLLAQGDTLVQGQLDPNDPILLPPVLALTEVNLQEILEQILTGAKAIATEKGLELYNHLPSHLPLIWGNVLALKEVFGNILDNATKYTPTSGAILIDAEVCAANLQVKIRDTGVGIPPSDLGHIFERSFRGRQARGSIGGTGLGLAIAQDLVEKMGGKILVSSELNVGTTFTVVLKLVNPQ